jgi:hypothetical protein
MLIPIHWLNPLLETNDELANSAVFARIVPALAIVLLEPKWRHLHDEMLRASCTKMSQQ